MARIPLISERGGLSAEQAAVFDQIVSSRGSLIRPFQVLLHAPKLASSIGDVGQVIRFQGTLSDADRELAILAAGVALGCGFVWDSHLEHAQAAGLGEAMAALQGGPGQLTARQRLLVTFVEQLTKTSRVTSEVFGALHDELGTEGVVELSAVVGYYTLLGFVMSVSEAC